jgi:ABC-type taurine transport system ATPase subunit
VRRLHVVVRSVDRAAGLALLNGKRSLSCRARMAGTLPRMLTQLVVRRFKQFTDVSIELGSPVVFIGPNDSGKTTALQAVALWDAGLRRWNEKRAGRSTPEKRPGVTINRRDLLAVPVPDAQFLWHDLGVRNVTRDDAGKQATQNLRIDIIVSGVTDGVGWECGLEFDYANAESIYCRPLRLPGRSNGERMPVPEHAAGTAIAFLPPMSGLVAQETRLDPGAINVRLGEGRTAEVLRNLCYRIYEENGPDDEWGNLVRQMRHLFGVELDAPRYIPERGEVTMGYRGRSGVDLDLATAGRGMQQTLLLLAHIAANPGAVLLLDEPDAHLEILRQRQIYAVLTDAARRRGSQIIAASHSEVILNEAADRDVVVAFVGKPHRIDDRGSQLLKALKEIGFEDYYQAEITGWVLYLEGATDLAILTAFAETLSHEAANDLARPFVKYVFNQPSKVRDHFFGLKEAKPALRGFALFDRLDTPLQSHAALVERMWTRREIENYLCQPETLAAWAEATAREPNIGPLSEEAAVQRRAGAMGEAIRDLVPPVALRDRNDRWWLDTKASDDFLDRLFPAYYATLGLPDLMRKSDYHQLARHVPADLVSDDVISVLDDLHKVASDAG